MHRCAGEELEENTPSPPSVTTERPLTFREELRSDLCSAVSTFLGPTAPLSSSCQGRVVGWGEGRSGSQRGEDGAWTGVFRETSAFLYRAELESHN